MSLTTDQRFKVWYFTYSSCIESLISKDLKMTLGKKEIWLTKCVDIATNLAQTSVQEYEK